jgi:chromosome segregation ATPase
VSLEGLRAKEEEINSQIISKDVLIGNLKQALNEMQIDKNRSTQEKSMLELRLEKLTSEIVNLKEVNSNLKDKCESSERKSNQFKAKLENLESETKESISKMKSRDKDEFALKTEISELKLKNAELCNEVEDKVKLVALKEGKLEKQTQKIKEL